MKDTPVDNLETRIFDAIKTAFKGMDDRFAQVAARAAITAVREWDKEQEAKVTHE